MDIELDSVTVTEQITNAAIYSALILLVMVTLLILQVIFLRVRFLYTGKQRHRLLKKWRPKITQVMLGDSSNMPVLPRNEVCVFLEEWNRMFGTVRGNNLAQLQNMAKKFKIYYFAISMIKTRSVHDKLLAIITLGHMQEYSAWDELTELLDDESSVISVTAARALMWIDSKHAVELIAPKIMARNDWTWSNVAHVLRQANPIQVCEHIANLVVNAPAEAQPGLLRYLESTHCLQLTDVINNILSTTEDDRVASVCLHITQDPNSLKTIRQYTSHPRWHVRMHAASALGRLGGKSDLKLLLNMVEDENWWVRYRAAQAIINIPQQNIETLKQIRDTQSDKYAKDILTHVIAEAE